MKKQLLVLVLTVFFVVPHSILGQTCTDPTDLRVTNLTENSADIYWTAGNGASTSWQVEYGLWPLTKGEGTLVLSSNDTLSLTGLVAGTPYSYYVREICSVGDTSEWVGPHYFLTLCPLSSVGDSISDPIIVPSLPYGNGRFMSCYTNTGGNFSDPDVYYRITTGPQAVGLTIEASGESSTDNTYLELFDAMGNSLISNNDISGANRFSRIRDYPVSPNTEYFVLSEVVLDATPSFLYTEMSESCAVVAAPLSQDFESGFVEGYHDGLDECWTFTSTNPGDSASGYSWEVTSDLESVAGTGANHDNTTGSGNFITVISTGSNAGDTASLLSPFVDFTGSSAPELKFFYHRFSSTDIPPLFVDVYDDGSWDLAVSTITDENQTSQSHDYDSAVVDLSAYANKTIRVRFRIISDGANNNDMALDDISFNNSCQNALPANLSVVESSITTTSATLDWDSDASINAWEVLVLASGATAPGPSSSGTSVTAGSFYNVTGRTANTAYDFYVKNACSSGGDSDWVGPYTFNTACEESNIETTLSEDFEGFREDHYSGPFDCWVFESTSSGTSTTGFSWEVANGTFYTGNPNHDNTLGNSTGNYIGLLAFGGSDDDSTMLTSPNIDMTVFSDPELSFYYFRLGSGSSMPDLHVDIYDGDQWNLAIQTVTNRPQSSAGDPYEESTVDLSSFANDTVKVRFRANYNTTFGSMAIDDISIRSTDDIIPTVTSIARQDPTDELTNADTVTFRVTFSENVNSVSTGSFELASGGVSGTVNAVSAVTGQSIYDIQVINISGDGVLDLDFQASHGITDLANNPFGGTIDAEQTYTIDNLAPELVISRHNPGTSVTNADSVTYLLTFSEAVVNVDVGDFRNAGGDSDGTLYAPITHQGNTTYLLPVGSITGEGNLGILFASALDIQDPAGNGVFLQSASIYSVDKTTQLPTLTAPASSGSTNTTVQVDGNLPETPASGSVELLFDGTTDRTLELNISSSGAFSFSFDPGSPTTASEVSSGASIPDGTYSVSLSYMDELGNAVATSAVATGFTIDLNEPTTIQLLEDRTVSYGAANDTIYLSSYFRDTTAITYGVASTNNQAVTPTLVTSSDTLILDYQNAGIDTITVTATDALGNDTIQEFSITVNKRALTATANDQSRDYGASNPTFTIGYTGFVNGDDTGDLDTAPIASTVATTASDVGSYPITVDGGSDNNYTLNRIDGTLTIDKATLTATADDQNRDYGTSNPTFTIDYTGFVNGDNASDLDTPPSATTVATTASDAGTYTITVNDDGSDNNYDFTTANGTLTIDKATLTATADDQNRDYGASNPTFTIDYTGFVNGDNASDLDTPPSATTTATMASDVGSYPITVSGGSDNNYTLNRVNGTLTILPVDQVITITPITDKEIGDPAFDVHATTDSGLPLSYAIESGPATISDSTITLTGVTGVVVVKVSQSGDINHLADSATTTFNVSDPTKMDQVIDFDPLPSSTYGDAPITLSATGGGSGNPVTFSSSETSVATINGTTLTIVGAGTSVITAAQEGNSTYNSATATQTLIVSKKTLVATAGSPSRDYGSSNPTFTIGYTGFVNGDGAGDLDTAPTASTVATVASGAGSYTITVSGGDDNNYDFSYVSGSLTINKINLTATADSPSRDYGSANPTFTIGYTGFVNGDNADSLDTAPTASTVATVASGAGTYPITVTGGTDNNYNFTLVGGTLTINKIILTATANDTSRDYGSSNPAFDISYTGFVNTDNADSLDTPPTATTTATTASDAGDYSISLSDGSDNNYNFTLVNGVLTVDKVNLTATADPQSRVYKTPNPILTISYDGFVNGEDESVLTTPPTATTTATIDSIVGNYPINLTGGDDENYNLLLVSGTLMVTKADQTIDFVLGTVTYSPGSYLHLSNFSTTSSGLLPIYESSNGFVTISNDTAYILGAGTVTITASQGGDDNYNAALPVDAMLTIEKASREVIIDQSSLSATYDENQHPVSLISPLDLTVDITYRELSAMSSSPTAPSDAGSYEVIASINDNNYQGSTTDTLVIGRANQSISFTLSGSVAFGETINLNGSADPSGLEVSYSSGNEEIATVSGDMLTVTGVGSTTITASQAGNSNYNAANDVMRSLTTVKADQSITFDLVDTITFGESVTMEGMATSGLTVSYNSSSAIASIDGNTLTGTGVGDVTITASQEGDTNYNEATDVEQLLTVVKADQTVTFNLVNDTIGFGDRIALGATVSSGLSVSYSVDNSSLASISNDTLTATGVGNITISAYHPGNTNYNASDTITRVLTIEKADQVISFDALDPVTFGDDPFALTATGGASGNSVTFSSSNTSVATVSGNSVTIVGAGTTTITASQLGNDDYNDASDVNQELTVNKATATVTLSNLEQLYDGSAKTPTVVTSPTGLTVTLTYDGSSTAPSTHGDYAVIATVNEDNYEGSATGTLSIVNAAPTDIALSNSSVPENESSGTVVGTLSATDANPDSHTYNLVPGFGDNGQFSITGNELLTDAIFDYESDSSYSIRIEVNDGLGGIYEESFTISITDVDENLDNNDPTDIILSNSSVAENASVGVAVGTLTASDPDAGDSHSFELVSGTGDDDNGLFDVNDNNELVTASVFDFETRSSYSVRLRTVDNNGGSFQEAFTITITNVNEAPTGLDVSSTTIEENQPQGTLIGTFSTTGDPDAGDTHTYSLVEGEGDDDNASFMISGDELRSDEVFDFESQSSYNIRIRTTDGGGLGFEATATIAVTDVADEPVISVSTSSINFAATGITLSSSEVFTIENTGNAILEVSGISVPSGFGVSPSTASVGVGASETITVTFSPTLVQAYSGDLIITSNTGSDTVALSGEGVIVTGVEPAINSEDVAVYPIPTSEYLTVEMDGISANNVKELTIYDVSGQRHEVKVLELRDNYITIDVSNFTEGTYALRINVIEGAAEASIIKRFIRQD